MTYKGFFFLFLGGCQLTPLNNTDPLVILIRERKHVLMEIDRRQALMMQGYTSLDCHLDRN